VAAFVGIRTDIARLSPGSLYASSLVRADIASSNQPATMFKAYAREIAGKTGEDAEQIKKELSAARAALNSASTLSGTIQPIPTGGTTQAAAWAMCAHLANDPNLVEKLLDIMRRLGVAGDKHGVLATCLVATSRLLSKPARMLRKGASASGKSHVIEVCLQILNSYDYVRLTAGSAKALIYSERDFRHTLIFIPEAAALVPGKNGSDEFAMMLREMISSGRLEYATVHPDAKGKPTGVVISKDGPVALLLTTARENVEEELETRMLVTITDESDSQTEAILRSIAASAAGNGPPKVSEAEIADWKALQDWLRLGPRDVVVPYSDILRSLVSRRAIRIRRDFQSLLSMVMASALLHRAQRQADTDGRIVATLQDYGYALKAVEGGLEEMVHGDTATIEAVRKAVELALYEKRRTERRDTIMGEFRLALLGYCKKQKLTDAAQRLDHAYVSPAHKSARATVSGCIGVAINGGADAAVMADTLGSQPRATARNLLRKAVAKARAGWNKPDALPSSVELSRQQLATRLGIGPRVARTRLENAIEAGAVVDVGALDMHRSSTAPRLLRDGAPVAVSNAATGKARRGAFPTLAALQDAVASKAGGPGGKIQGQPAKQRPSP
jgi:hypothetical protein